MTGKSFSLDVPRERRKIKKTMKSSRRKRRRRRRMLRRMRWRRRKMERRQKKDGPVDGFFLFLPFLLFRDAHKIIS